VQVNLKVLVEHLQVPEVSDYCWMLGSKAEVIQDLWYQNWTLWLILMGTKPQKCFPQVTELWLSLVHLVHHRFPKVWNCWMLGSKAEVIQDSPKGNQWLHQG
jgi:hypothetical protein